MRSRPDLTFPSVPDVEEDAAATHRRSVERGGTNLRDESMESFEWPEAGPSRLPQVGTGVTTPASGVSPFQAKVVASITGAVVVSLLMTPFDVVKTRLQTVQPPSRLSSKITIPKLVAEECCQTSLLSQPTKSNPLTCYTSAATSSSTPSTRFTAPLSALQPAATPASPPSGCLQPSKWAGIWGEAVTLEEAMARRSVGLGLGGAGGGTASLVMPAEGLGGMMGGFWNEIATIRRQTGARGLWKGVGTTITMSIPSASIYMLGYEYLLTHISPIFTGSSDPADNVSSLNRTSANSVTASLTPAPLVAGALARTISATVISPIEMFRTRLQALPGADGLSPTYASTTKEMGKLVKSQGLTMLWRGLGPTLWRDVPFSGIYWAGFEVLKTYLSANNPSLSPLTTSFISGAVSGTISALLTQPFDVLKTRRQVFTPSPNCSPAALRSHASTIPLAIHVIKTEGAGALMAGLTARCGKVAPACGLMIASYEGVGRWLSGGNSSV